MEELSGDEAARRMALNVDSQAARKAARTVSDIRLDAPQSLQGNIFTFQCKIDHGEISCDPLISAAFTLSYDAWYFCLSRRSRDTSRLRLRVRYSVMPSRIFGFSPPIE